MKKLMRNLNLRKPAHWAEWQLLGKQAKIAPFALPGGYINKPAQDLRIEATDTPVDPAAPPADPQDLTA